MAKSEVLEMSLDASPATDHEAERMFLVCLFVMYQQDRNRATMALKPDAFHDPFHRWLFRGIRQARDASTTDELLRFLRYEHVTPKWIAERFGAWIAGLFCNGNGSFLESDYRLMASYVTRVQSQADKRARIEELEAQLLKELS